MLMDPRTGAPRVRDLVPSALPRTSRMAGDHHSPRTDAFVLGLAPLLAAPCLGSLPP